MVTCCFRKPYLSSRDAGRSKLLSWDAHCDNLKTAISIYQKKALGELYQALPLSSCAFNVCISSTHFYFFPYKFLLNENAKALCLYCTDSKGKNICVPQWDKLWYDFPVFYREQAVSLKTVDLPESQVESRVECPLRIMYNPDYPHTSKPRVCVIEIS